MTNQNDQKFFDKSRAKKLGIFLIVLSFVLYAGLLLVPFIPLTIGIKAAISTTLIISGEATFWVGCLILGKELAKKYKKYLNPLRWFKRMPDKNSDQT